MVSVKSGKTYLGFYCVECSEPIPVAEDPSGGKVNLRGPGRFRLTCQKCDHVADYAADEAQHLTAHTMH